MENIVNEFNNTASMCVDFILGVTGDSDIKFYKKAADAIISADKFKAIEHYIAYCLPHQKYIFSYDESYFINMDYGSMRVNKNSDNLFHVLKLRKYFTTLDKDIKNLIFEYQKLLCNFSMEYLKHRFQKKKT